MTRLRSVSLATIAAVTLGLVTGTTGTPAADPVTLRIATSDIYGVANTFSLNGDDKVNGVVFENFRFSGGVPAMLAALKAGQIDVAEVGAASPIIAQAAGSEFKVIAATQPWPKGEAIIVADNSPIKTVEDLRGKKVAYPRATNAQWLVIHALRSKGLTLKNIDSTFLPQGTNLLTALKAGVIDATAYIDIPLASYEAQGTRRIVDHGDLGYPIAVQFLASDEAIKTRKAAVATYVHQLAKHLAWAHANPEVRAEALAKIWHLDTSVVLVAEKRRPPGLQPISETLIHSNQEIADAFFSEGVIPKKLTVDSTFTTEFNADATP